MRREEALEKIISQKEIADLIMGVGLLTGFVAQIYAPTRNLRLASSSLALAVIFYGFGKVKEHYSSKVRALYPEGVPSRGGL